jgi:hypothetical protein
MPKAESYALRNIGKLEVDVLVVRKHLKSPADPYPNRSFSTATPVLDRYH